MDSEEMRIIDDVPVNLKIELGSTIIKAEDIIGLKKGSIINLQTSTGEPVKIYANDTILIGYGEITDVNGYYGVKITKMEDYKKEE